MASSAAYVDEPAVRALMLKGDDRLEASKLQVMEYGFGASCGYVYRHPDYGTLSGRVIAIQRTNEEMAAGLLEDLLPKIAEQTMRRSPYEGKPGRHPDICTCSRHRR
jgi:hypothetical protein